MENLSTESIVLIFSVITVLGILCQWLAWQVKLPAILFLLLAGIVAGPVTGLIVPDELFGDLLFPFVSLAVAIILFEGSLTLRFDEIKGIETVVRRLVTSGLVITWIITAVATHYIVGFSWELAFLFGALTVVTGPTVIVPMLRTVRPTERIANILKWEGIIIDPVGALLAVLVFGFIISGQGSSAIEHTMLTFAKTVIIGTGLGAIGGYLFGYTLRHHWLPEYLHTTASVAVVFIVFATSNALQHESGLLAVTVLGIWLANMRNVPIDEILDFKENLTLLLISSLFIILAARIEFDDLATLGWSAALIFLVIQFIARPLKIIFSTFGSSLSWQEKALLSWICPRGIVAAAVSALFALRLQESGDPAAGLLVPLTFLVIIGTVVLQSSTSGFIAKALGVADPEPNGFLVIGANTVARTITKALNENNVSVILADGSWDNIRDARMEGLRTYYGNPVSSHADRHLDLVGVGRMLAITPHAELGTLASMRYKTEFGRNSIYALPAPEKNGRDEKHIASEERRGNMLFSKDTTYAKLASLISQGAIIRTTTLTDEFSYEQYREKYGNKAIPLFGFDKKNRIHVFIDDGKQQPEAGWKILGLITADVVMENRDTDLT